MIGATATTLCQMALDTIGSINGIGTISDLSENSPEARLCRRWYQSTVDGLLAQRPWTFALSRVTLAPVQTTVPFPWKAALAVPGDCLTVRTLLHPQSLSNGQGLPYELMVIPGTGGRQQVLYSPISAADLIYTVQAEPALFPALFQDAVVNALAANICEALTGNHTLTQRCEQAATLAFTLADQWDARQSWQQPALQAEDVYLP